MRRRGLYWIRLVSYIKKSERKLSFVLKRAFLRVVNVIKDFIGFYRNLIDLRYKSK